MSWPVLEFSLGILMRIQRDVSNNYSKRYNSLVSLHFVKRNYPTGTGKFFLEYTQRNHTFRNLVFTVLGYFLSEYCRETKELFLCIIIFVRNISLVSLGYTHIYHSLRYLFSLVLASSCRVVSLSLL